MPETSSDKKIRPARKKENDAALSSYLFGKVPPQARNLEDAVLGAMMLQKSAVAEVIEFLKPDHFYHEPNQNIYGAILDLFEKSEPVDVLTVTENLKQKGLLDKVGGPYYIAELTNRVASAANIEYHARLVSQKFIQRDLIRIGTNVVNEAFEDTTDVFDLLQKSEQQIYEITDQNLRKGWSKSSSLISQALKEIEIVKDREDDIIGVPTGFSDLDAVTNGWQKSDLIILAARPGMGKTSFVLSIARNAAVDFGKNVAFFSLEMSAVQLTKRLISSETEISLNKLRSGDLKDHEFQQIIKQTENLSNANIYIDDTPAINVFELRAKCRRLKQQHNIDMVIIDYLQLMSGMKDNKSFNREQEISNISRNLKTIAKELDIPVIALSQLSRAVETRGGNKKPMLSDLRESGAIEQDADLVVFIYRPEYYGINEMEDGTPSQNMAEIMIKKHRNGPIKDVPVYFINEYAKFIGINEFSSTGNLVPLSSVVDDEGKNVITLKSNINKEGGQTDNNGDNSDLPF